MSVSSELSPIGIPYSPKRSANIDRYGYGGSGDKPERCLICGKPIDTVNAAIVVLDETCSEIIAPPDDQSRTGGCFYIGADCWRRNRQLHAYEV